MAPETNEQPGSTAAAAATATQKPGNTPPSPVAVVIAPPAITLNEYCAGRPDTISRALKHGLAALHGDPRHVSKTAEEWAKLEREFWQLPAKH